MSTTQKLAERGLIRPPRWLPTNIHYETIMGSLAYGVSSDASDLDIYGWAIPPKSDVFPHLRGEIAGFGTPARQFEQFQEHHIQDSDALGGRGRQYDICIYGIVKFFQLALENNPNSIDSLFTPVSCVLHCTRIGNHVREQRRLFLHRGAWHKFKGYAYTQMHKLSTKSPRGRRAELIARHGYDTKFAYHVVRLLGEVEQILIEGDIDLQRNSEQLKSIRRGDWTLDELRAWFTEKERALEQVYLASSLPAVPPEDAIRQLLLECLEEHYGSLSECVVQPDAAIAALKAVQSELDRVRHLLD